MQIDGESYVKIVPDPRKWKRFLCFVFGLGKPVVITERFMTYEAFTQAQPPLPYAGYTSR